MRKQTLTEKAKELIAGIGFRMFLWGSSLTEDEYLKQVYNQEYSRIHKQHISDGI